MASIHRRTRADGSVAFQVKWREGGRPRSITATTAAGAKRIKGAVESTGTWRDDMGRDDVPTVKEQAETFLGNTRGNSDTVKDYRRIYDQHIGPAFGELAITALTVPMLTTWARGLERQDGRPGPVSDKTRANVTAVMAGILESAVPDHLPSSPWRKVRLPRTDPPRELHLLTADDFRILLAEIPEHYRPLVVTLAMTGMRWGEVAALTVADLTITKGLPVFRVAKGVKHHARQTDAPGLPKTKRAVRVVTGPAGLVDVLRPLLERPASAPLFPAERGGRLRNSTFHSIVWQPALDRAVKAGLPFRPEVRELRNAATTWMIEGGVPLDIVADQLGHESVTTTFNIYRRVNPESGRKAAAAMGAVLDRVSTPAIED